MQATEPADLLRVRECALAGMLAGAATTTPMTLSSSLSSVGVRARSKQICTLLPKNIVYKVTGGLVFGARNAGACGKCDEVIK